MKHTQTLKFRLGSHSQIILGIHKYYEKLSKSEKFAPDTLDIGFIIYISTMSPVED